MGTSTLNREQEKNKKTMEYIIPPMGLEPLSASITIYSLLRFFDSTVTIAKALETSADSDKEAARTLFTEMVGDVVDTMFYAFTNQNLMAKAFPDREVADENLNTAGKAVGQ